MWTGDLSTRQEKRCGSQKRARRERGNTGSRLGPDGRKSRRQPACPYRQSRFCKDPDGQEQLIMVRRFESRWLVIVLSLVPTVANATDGKSQAIAVGQARGGPVIRNGSPTVTDDGLFVPDPASVTRHGPAWRYPQSGWNVVHIEGAPYDRG